MTFALVFEVVKKKKKKGKKVLTFFMTTLFPVLRLIAPKTCKRNQTKATLVRPQPKSTAPIDCPETRTNAAKTGMTEGENKAIEAHLTYLTECSFSHKFIKNVVVRYVSGTCRHRPQVLNKSDSCSIVSCRR